MSLSMQSDGLIQKADYQTRSAVIPTKVPTSSGLVKL
jgi:hypothetical protein